MQDEEKLALEHAWRYFQAHAEQRITVFNFFVATAGLLVTGLAFTAQAPSSTWPLGLMAGLLLILIALVFWKLDQRVSSMIKVSEDVIARAESSLIVNPDLRVISRERDMTAITKFGYLHAWSYGQAFRRVFLIMAIIGLAGSIFSAGRALPLKSEIPKGKPAIAQPVPSTKPLHKPCVIPKPPAVN